MAPSATEAVESPHIVPILPSKIPTVGFGQGGYKELAGIGYEKEAEEKGKDGFAAAKVSDYS